MGLIIQRHMGPRFGGDIPSRWESTADELLARQLQKRHEPSGMQQMQYITWEGNGVAIPTPGEEQTDKIGPAWTPAPLTYSRVLYLLHARTSCDEMGEKYRGEERNSPKGQRKARTRRRSTILTAVQLHASDAPLPFCRRKQRRSRCSQSPRRLAASSS